MLQFRRCYRAPRVSKFWRQTYKCLPSATLPNPLVLINTTTRMSASSAYYSHSLLVNTVCYVVLSKQRVFLNSVFNSREKNRVNGHVTVQSNRYKKKIKRTHFLRLRESFCLLAYFIQEHSMYFGIVKPRRTPNILLLISVP